MNPWTLFWTHGHSTTFGDYFKRGYKGAVAEWWQSEIDALPPEATILEVGCGNCSLLPALIKSGRKDRYIGVDLASVAPSKVAQEGLAASDIEVVLHPNTPAEEIPEPDGSVDLLASVFGIEYANLDKSLQEALRVLKPGGKFRALLHHSDSVVTSMSRRAMSEYNDNDVLAVGDALAVISAARDKVPTSQALKGNMDAENARMKLNRFAEKYLSDKDPKTANATMFEFMTNALNFFKQLDTNTETRRDFLKSLVIEQRASNERFRQMVAVAFDVASIEQFQTKMQELGYSSVTVNVLNTNDEILAWQIAANK